MEKSEGGGGKVEAPTEEVPREEVQPAFVISNNGENDEAGGGGGGGGVDVPVAVSVGQEAGSSIGVVHASSTEGVTIVNASANSIAINGEGGVDQSATTLGSGSGIPATMDGMEAMEGYTTLMMGDDGEEYVTVVQDGQTYAIPANQYHEMQAGTTLTFTALETTTHPQQFNHTQVQHHQIQHQHQVQHQHQAQHIVNDPSMIPLPPSSEKKAVKDVINHYEGSPITPTTTGNDGPKMGSSSSQPSTKPFKTIRVENWGIFLLTRLTAYFQKKEYCDLILRFPSRNAQIKVHKLVVNACTDYFASQETSGRLIDGVLDMGHEFSPEAVAPIIRFMYSGLLDLKEGMFETIRETARLLEMSVLTKLMDAQYNEKAFPPATKNIKRKRSYDPVKQIKHIKRIEKKFNIDEKKAKIMAAKNKMDSDCLPGKKLPIWKKRSTSIPSYGTQESSPGQSRPRQIDQKVKEDVSNHRLEESTEMTRKEDENQQIVVEGPAMKQEPETIQMPTPTVSRTYSKKSTPGEVPRVSSKLREMQQTMLFEKVRRTAAKNPQNISNADSDNSREDVNKDMTVDEMKEFMEEQRKRLNLDEDEDYYNDHEEMTYDDHHEDDEDDEDIDVPVDLNDSNEPKPILKSSGNFIGESILPDTSDNVNEDDNIAAPRRKSVRFSLRPGSVPTPKDINRQDSIVSSEEISSPSPVPPSETPNQRHGRPTEISSNTSEETSSKSDADIDNTLENFVDTNVDEFNKAIEKENDTTQIVAKKSAPPVSPVQNNSSSSSSPSSSLPKLITSASLTDQAALISQALKQHPDIFKDNKKVRLKVKVQDPTSGKMVLKTITVRAQDQQSLEQQQIRMKLPPTKAIIAAAAADVSSPGTKHSVLTDGFHIGIRAVPKVKYTGKRGRPKKVLQGEVDPHAAQRIEIDHKLKTIGSDVRLSTETPMNEYIITQNADLDESLTTTTTTLIVEGPDQTNKTVLRDPSSEAEAMANVASGIATSLGVNYEVNSGSSSDYKETINSSSNNDTEGSKKATELAMDWEEEEEDEGDN